MEFLRPTGVRWGEFPVGTLQTPLEQSMGNRPSVIGPFTWPNID